jgi:hypothetical protein
MTALEAPPELHPVHGVARCLEAIAEALDQAPAGPIPAADPHVLEVVVVEASRVERQLRELRLRLARAAEQSRAAEADASTGADAWLARLTGTTSAVMRGGLWLARMLDERYPVVREAFASGGIGEEHARIIVRTAERMPAQVSDAERDEAVRALVDQAVDRRMNTKTLRRRARRMLDVVNRLHADQHEAHVLEEQEGQAAHTA